MKRKRTEVLYHFIDVMSKLSDVILLSTKSYEALDRIQFCCNEINRLDCIDDCNPNNITLSENNLFYSVNVFHNDKAASLNFEDSETAFRAYKIILGD